jgi:hypothetical protein
MSEITYNIQVPEVPLPKRDLKKIYHLRQGRVSGINFDDVPIYKQSNSQRNSIASLPGGSLYHIQKAESLEKPMQEKLWYYNKDTNTYPKKREIPLRGPKYRVFSITNPIGISIPGLEMTESANYEIRSDEKGQLNSKSIQAGARQIGSVRLSLSEQDQVIRLAPRQVTPPTFTVNKSDVYRAQPMLVDKGSSLNAIDSINRSIHRYRYN